MIVPVSPPLARPEDLGLERKPQTAPGLVHLEVEVVAFRLQAGVLLARAVHSAVARGEHPDQAAIRQLGGRLGAEAVSHSTSWRFEGGRVVVTYAVLPDPEPELPSFPVEAMAVMTSGQPLLPTPRALHHQQVVAHAIWHLAGLRQRDPFVSRVATRDPELWTAIATAAAGAWVGTHQQIHAAIGEVALRPVSAGRATRVGSRGGRRSG